MPIIPLILVNGSEGIGTGWSSNVSEMATLWEVSERETGIEFDVAALVEATR